MSRVVEATGPRVRARVALAVALVLALGAAPADAAERSTRSLTWSGYRWTIRSTTHRADPGHNRWGDSRWNAHVRADGRLRLNISKGRAVEVIGPRTTYGRYRWVVDSDLAGAHPFRVLAFFVRGTGGEQDIEFSRWGDPAMPTVGSWVTWWRTTRLAFGLFGVTPLAPYTVEIDWRVRTTRFSVRDAGGAALLDTTSPSSPGRSHIAPRMSYWLFPGRGTSRSPFRAASVHPPVLLRSFRFTAAR